MDLKQNFSENYESWGRVEKPSQEICHGTQTGEFQNFLSSLKDQSVLPYGRGRSYGDSCLNDGGFLLATHRLKKILSFDVEKGILRCESGMTLGEVIKTILPKGWFLPVIPGSQMITLGGAVANDVHGKNHSLCGSFGCHLTCFELLRSDGSLLFCSRVQNSDLFFATIGGLGLTGLITWAEIKLLPICSSSIKVKTIACENIESVFTNAENLNEDFQYQVAWLDSTAKGSSLGRGILSQGRHLEVEESLACHPKTPLKLPFSPPFSLITDTGNKIFNKFYYYKNTLRKDDLISPLENFFFPLDRIGNWNFLYGRKGFFQYQGVFPKTCGFTPIAEILEEIQHSNSTSFLSVLKFFGGHNSQGWLSFPMEGSTLSIDLNNQGQKTLELLSRLNNITLKFGGRVYPAKDSRMNPETFKASFPNWKEIETIKDPCFSSNFWRRVTGDRRAQ